MTFRLALAYSAWFVVSYAAMGAIAWRIFVTAPLAEVRATVLAEVRTLSALHEKHGVDALVDALDVRRESPSRRRAFHALVAKPVVPLRVRNLRRWRRAGKRGLHL
jgi:hypothetical protein